MQALNGFNDHFIDNLDSNGTRDAEFHEESVYETHVPSSAKLQLAMPPAPAALPPGSRSDTGVVPSTKSPFYRGDFERLRQDGLWDKVIDLAEQLKQSQNGANDSMIHFYLGEARLEQLVDAIHQNRLETLTDEMKKALVDVKKFFDQLLKMTLPVEVVRLLRFLLAKTFFLLGDPNECVINLDKGYLGEADLSLESNRRNLKIFAEAFCLRGMCMSTIPVLNGKMKRTEKLDRQMLNFESANDLSLRCSQMTDMVVRDGRDGVGSLADLGPFQLGNLLENALARTPNMYAKHGMLASALVRFRDTLRTVETPGTRKSRLTLARQLLEMLLRGYLGVHYIDTRLTERLDSAGKTATSTIPRPKRYPTNGSFIPLAILEEVILLLYICEAVIVRDLTIRQAGDADTRKLLLSSSLAVADLGTIAFSRLYHISLGVPFLERASKSCPGSSHIWKQLALNLIVKGEYTKGLRVLDQCFRLTPKDRTLFIFAAKVCVDYLMDLDQGIRYAEELTKLTEKSRYSGRAWLILGVAYSLKAMKIRDLDRQADLRKQSIEFYRQAESEEPGDFLIHYHLALEYSLERKMDDAFRSIKKCLRINMDFLPAHHLLALILSCSRRYEDALSVLEKAELEFTEDVEMELTKIRLQGRIRGPENALKSCRHLLWTWKSKYERDLQDADRERLRTMSPEVPYPVSPNIFSAQLSPLPQFPNTNLAVSTSKTSPSTPGIVPPDRTDAVSHRAESAATLTRTEGGTMSEMASTTGSYLARTSAQRAFTSQVNIWTLMTELYLSLDQLEQALECLLEAANIGPPNHHIFYLQGVIALNKGTSQDAKKCFGNALSINPWHPASHIQMGQLQRKEMCDAEAERHFKAALQGDPCCHEAWSALGDLYIQKGNDEKAMEYLDKARKMEVSSPIEPFYHLSRSISY